MLLYANYELQQGYLLLGANISYLIGVCYCMLIIYSSMVIIMPPPPPTTKGGRDILFLGRIPLASASASASASVSVSAKNFLPAL